MFRITTLVALMVFAMFAPDVWAGPPPAKQGEEYELVVIAGMGSNLDDQKKPISYGLVYKRSSEQFFSRETFNPGCEWTQKTEKGEIKVKVEDLCVLWANPKGSSKGWIRRETKSGKVLEIYHPDTSKGWEK